MITHSIPCGDAALSTAPAGVARAPAARAGATPARPAGGGGDGPLRVQLHPAARCQGGGVPSRRPSPPGRPGTAPGALLLFPAPPAPPPRGGATPSPRELDPQSPP